MLPMTAPTLAEIATRIDAHLKRFEADPAINKPTEHFDTPFFAPKAARRDVFVDITYNHSRRTWQLLRAEATAYLAFLDAGGVGTHYDMARQAKEAA